MGQENGIGRNPLVLIVQNTMDYELGFLSGVGLARVDAFLNEQVVMQKANEIIDMTPWQQQINRWHFVLGMARGYGMYRDGFI
jgi:hypothetical protein